MARLLAFSSYSHASLKFVEVPSDFNVFSDNVPVIGAAIAAGLYPKFVKLEPNSELRTLIKQQPVAIVRTS